MEKTEMKPNKSIAIALALLLPVSASATTFTNSENKASVYTSQSESTKKPLIYKTRVIADRGGIPSSNYMPKNVKEQELRIKEFEQRKRRTLTSTNFPVVSKKLTVGPLGKDEGKDINYNVLAQPLFMIGYDAVSMNWLKANRNHLAKNKAIGFVVNVENKEQLRQLQKIAGKNVVLQPTPGDDLSEHLKIKHYPFYMDNKGVMR